MEIIKHSFHIYSLKINQRTLRVHVCISAHRNTYTHCILYTCVYVYIYIHLYKCIYTHISKMCVCVFIEETDNIFIFKNIHRISRSFWLEKKASGNSGENVH